MKLFAKKTPWYIAGLAFECQECGHCCAGPQEGYVWATPAEITAIAAHLEMEEGTFRRRYVRKAHRRFSLKEQPDTKDCIFLQRNDSGGKGCAIYGVRPTQCRTWPFWASNISSPESWADAQQRCIGINRGPMHSPGTIDDKANVTRE